MMTIPSRPLAGRGLSDATSPAETRAMLNEQGYAIVRGLVPAARCDEALAAFHAEVKPSRRFFVRHRTGLPERHIFTEHGFMKYPIMNPHELNRREFGLFRNIVLDLFTDTAVIDTVRAVLETTPKLVHTMVFEGNQKTWVHRDADYIDASESGRLVGLWVALQEIAPGAGRFFVYPRSHRLELPNDGLDPNSDDYVKVLTRFLEEHAVVCVAPALAKGDVLLWSSKTLHGSLETRQPELPRPALTAHYIRESDDLIWLKRRVSRAAIRQVRGLGVVFHSNQESSVTRIRQELIGRFPGPYKRLVAAVQRLKWVMRSVTHQGRP